MKNSRVRSFRPLNRRAAGAGRRLTLALLMLLPSLGAAGATTAGLTVKNPSVRFIIKSRPAAGYFTLRNNTGSAVDLTGASSSACSMVMLHQSKAENGVEKMLPVKSVSVPPHGTIRFAPGGYHLMCMSPSMKVGATVPITLKFADGQSVAAQFPVTGPTGK
jgi:periplasmic copper chaperone A